MLLSFKIKNDHVQFQLYSSKEVDPFVRFMVRVREDKNVRIDSVKKQFIDCHLAPAINLKIFNLFT